MSSNPTTGRRTTLSLAGLIAVASATLVLAVSGAHEGHADTGHGHADAVAVSAKTTAKQAKFQDAMRKLWEDHITWTRLAIVSFAHDLPDLPATEARLLRNRTTSGTRSSPTTDAPPATSSPRSSRSTSSERSRCSRPPSPATRP